MVKQIIRDGNNRQKQLQEMTHRIINLENNNQNENKSPNKNSSRKSLGL